MGYAQDVESPDQVAGRQEIIKRDNDKSIGAAMAEAQAALKERGKPEESILLNSPDLPFLRKGDAVEVAAGNAPH